MLTPDKSETVYFNQTVATCQHGWQGCKINPRNLTLWINETGQLDMAIAYLSQSQNFIYDHPEIDESWECRNPQETDLGMKLVFSQNSAYSSAGSYASYQDILLINGSSQLLISKLILVIVFVISMNS